MIIEINKDRCKEWDDFVNRRDLGYFFTFEWRDLIEKHYSYRPMYLASVENSEINGILPSFVIESPGSRLVCSMPLFWYGGPIGEKKLELLSELEKKSKPTRIMIATQPSTEKPYVYHGFGIGREYRVYTLKVTDEEDIWRNYEKSNKKAIKKAKGFGVEIIQAKTNDEFDKFYHLYVETMKRKRLTAYRYHFLKELFNTSRAKVYLAMINGKPLATLYCIYHENVIYLFIGGRNVSEDRYKAGNIMRHNIIKNALNDNYDYIYFGGSDVENAGLRHYKSSFGTEEKIQYILFKNKFQLSSLIFKGVQKILGVRQ